MPAKLVSDDGKHIVIRPMAYVKEEDTERYAEAKPAAVNIQRHRGTREACSPASRAPVNPASS